MSEISIAQTLETLRTLAPAGFALGFQVEYTTPTFMFQTYPKPWVDFYSQNGLVLSDPTIVWGFKSTGAIRWSALTEDDPHDIMAKAADYGMRYGVSFSMITEGVRSFGSFSHATREFTDAQIDHLQTHMNDLDARTRRIKATSPDETAALKELSLRLRMADET